MPSRVLLDEPAEEYAAVLDCVVVGTAEAELRDEISRRAVGGPEYLAARSRLGGEEDEEDE